MKIQFGMLFRLAVSPHSKRGQACTIVLSNITLNENVQLWKPDPVCDPVSSLTPFHVNIHVYFAGHQQSDNFPVPVISFFPRLSNSNVAQVVSCAA